MEEGFDKEIDSLLRRLPGAAAGSRPRGNGATAGGATAHLDADELSAFAEGSLPASARVAASAHLADCDECRGLVVNLARAAGVEGMIEKRAAASVPATTSEPSRLRAWFAAMFEPGALRYVAPVLAMCLVAAVTFVTLRSRRAEERVAQSASTSAPRSPITSDQTTDASGALQPTSNTATNANASVPSAAAGNAAGGAAAHAPASTGATASENEPARESPAGGPSSSARTDSLDAASPPAPPKDEPPPPEQKTAASETVTVTREQPRAAQPVETGTDQSQQRTSNLSRGEAQQQSPDGSRGQSGATVNGRQNESVNGGRNAAIAGGLASGVMKEDRDRGAASTTARRARPSDDKHAKTEEDGAAASDAETRNVAGHRFRREGGAWVDVNYKPSMSSTGVHRGTDSYRALVADIPELGRVADQLGGEVVVVVRGRAYRIR
ncbi:MAG TPA: hypothetical protein VFA21_14870 [Pyrinomonadaceae bacterium]|nr:hypothetical protein [Pyrinomonadaceae bacterium]